MAARGVTQKQSASHLRSKKWRSSQIDFTQPFPDSDVMILIQRHKVYAVSAILRMASPRFADWLSRYGNTIDLQEMGTAVGYHEFCELMAILHPRGGRTHRVDGRR